MPLTKKQPSIILVKPQMGENIGSAARAMLNFGLENMRVVAARDGWPSQSAVATASGARPARRPAGGRGSSPRAAGEFRGG